MPASMGTNNSHGGRKGPPRHSEEELAARDMTEMEEEEEKEERGRGRELEHRRDKAVPSLRAARANFLATFCIIILDSLISLLSLSSIACRLSRCAKLRRQALPGLER